MIITLIIKLSNNEKVPELGIDIRYNVNV